jgi:hypothetical protein
MNVLRTRPIRILWEAVSEVLQKREPLLRALTLPAALMVVLTGLYLRAGTNIEAYWFLYGVWLLIYAVFAVSCHRIILLGDDSLPNAYGLYWSMRETRFLGWFILVVIIYTLVSLPLRIATTLLPGWFHALQLSWYLPIFLTAYFEGRISMVLPATAVDERSNIFHSWRITRGYGMAIAIALFLVALVMDLIIITTNFVLPDSPRLAKVVSDALGFPLVAVAVGVLSVTYRRLSRTE